MQVAVLIAFIAFATVAAVLSSRQENGEAGQGGVSLPRAIAYWVLTLIVAFELAAGGLWDLLRIEYVRVVLTHLGYPLYLLYILGIPRIPCALVLLAPGLPRLKEWAYAGAFFDYAGASASHLLVGDRTGEWLAPLVFSAFTITSWALRPKTRRLSRPASATEIHATAWAVPVLIIVAMLVVAFLTLPKGAPPS